MLLHILELYAFELSYQLSLIVFLFDFLPSPEEFFPHLFRIVTFVFPDKGALFSKTVVGSCVSHSFDCLYFHDVTIY